MSTSSSSSSSEALFRQVKKFQCQLTTPKQIVYARMKALGQHPENYDTIEIEEKSCQNDVHQEVHQEDDFIEEQEGLAPILVQMLKEATTTWLQFINRKNGEKRRRIANQMETNVLFHVLKLHHSIVRMDITLAEEMAKAGSHMILSKLIQLDVYDLISSSSSSDSNNNNDTTTTTVEENEEDEDVIVEIQDIACEIAYNCCSGSTTDIVFPVKISPFTKEELCHRLPLVFHVEATNHSNNDGNFVDDEVGDDDDVPDKVNLWIHQVTDRQSAQEDVGFVMWPSAVVLSKWLLLHPKILQDKSILELGSGCGLTGLVAGQVIAQMGRHHHQSTSNDKIPSLPATTSGFEEEKKEDCNTISMKSSTTIENTTNPTTSLSSSSRVILSDFNSKVLTNLDRNIALNGLSHVASTTYMDFYAHDGKHHHGGWVSHRSGISHTTDDSILSNNNDISSSDSSTRATNNKYNQPPVDLILAADIICKPSDSVAVSKTIYDALKPGGEAIIVSANAKHRFGVDIFEDECSKVGLDIVDVRDVMDLMTGGTSSSGSSVEHEEDDDSTTGQCGIHQTSGYVEGMKLTMFRIMKPLLGVHIPR
jgi:predicted nicotinamide N-methyase